MTAPIKALNGCSETFKTPVEQKGIVIIADDISMFLSKLIAIWTTDPQL